jgi:hypothetical protein
MFFAFRIASPLVLRVKSAKTRKSDNFDKQFLSTPTSIEVHQLLKVLPAKIAIVEKKTYLMRP